MKARFSNDRFGFIQSLLTADKCFGVNENKFNYIENPGYYELSYYLSNAIAIYNF